MSLLASSCQVLERDVGLVQHAEGQLCLCVVEGEILHMINIYLLFLHFVELHLLLTKRPTMQQCLCVSAGLEERSGPTPSSSEWEGSSNLGDKPLSHTD